MACIVARHPPRRSIAWLQGEALQAQGSSGSTRSLPANIETLSPSMHRAFLVAIGHCEIHWLLSATCRVGWPPLRSCYDPVAQTLWPMLESPTRGSSVLYQASTPGGWYLNPVLVGSQRGAAWEVV